MIKTNYMTHKINISCLIFVFFLSYDNTAQNNIVYLIGDGGEWKEKKGLTSVVFEQLKKDFEKEKRNKTVIFLGDNVYPKGLPAKPKKESHNYKAIETTLLNQISIFEEFNGNVYFIPGNHDWARGKIGGRKRVLRQSEFINNYINENSSNLANKHVSVFQPVNALPGPFWIDIDDMRLIIIDTQWFLQGKFPNGRGKVKGTSVRKTKKLFWCKLDSLMTNTSGNVILAAHHPLQSVGGHGKKTSIGSKLLYGTLGQIASTLILRTLTPYMLFSQDIRGPKYRTLKNKLIESINLYSGKSLIYAAGHEHNLQYWQKYNKHYLVSGSGSKGDDYDMNLKKYYEQKDSVKLIYPKTQYDQKLGYFKIIIDENSKVKIEIIKIIGDSREVLFME